MIPIVLPFIKYVIPKHVSAICLWPFVLFTNAQSKADNTVIYHEKIHARQQLELLIVPFYLIYIGEYVYYRLIGQTHHQAYRSISFEREAYTHQDNSEYLQSRKPYNMWR